MTNLRIADLDRRVEALLTDPERYFAAARARAWTSARAEVAADLARRARTRQDHHPDGRAESGSGPNAQVASEPSGE